MIWVDYIPAVMLYLHDTVRVDTNEDPGEEFPEFHLYNFVLNTAYTIMVQAFRSLTEQFQSTT